MGQAGEMVDKGPYMSDKADPRWSASGGGQQDFFGKLLLLPLFQGIGRGEFLEIAERIRIGFHKVSGRQVIVEQDELCTHLVFVLHGDVCVSRESDSHSYCLTEWFQQPMVIQPEALFGLSTRYSRRFSVRHSAEILKVEKAAVRDILFYYPTFRINYLNLVSTQMQQAARQLWRPWPETLPARFTHFMALRCLRPAGQKELTVKMSDLAAELNSPRINVSRMLHGLEERELIELERGRIFVPAMEQLLQKR